MIVRVIKISYLYIRNKKSPECACRLLFRGNTLKYHGKFVYLQNISELQPTLPFTEYDFYKKYQATFKSSLLGKIYELLPLRCMRWL